MGEPVIMWAVKQSGNLELGTLYETQKDASKARITSLAFTEHHGTWPEFDAVKVEVREVGDG